MQGRVFVKRYSNRLTASVENLAADYKHKGYERHYAWDRFIIERGLIPGIDAKQFYAIFDRVSPYPLDGVESVAFSPTHMDYLLPDRPIAVQMTTLENGVTEVVWANGSTGSYPPCFPPDPARFVKIEEV